MNHEYAAQDARGIRGINGGPTSPSPQRTLAARLESAAGTIQAQCNRVEDVLAKINGTPRNPPMGSDRAEKIATTAPLAMSVDAVEALAKRLCDLASNLEQVA